MKALILAFQSSLLGQIPHTRAPVAQGQCGPCFWQENVIVCLKHHHSYISEFESEQCFPILQIQALQSWPATLCPFSLSNRKGKGHTHIKLFYNRDLPLTRCDHSIVRHTRTMRSLRTKLRFTAGQSFFLFGV